MTKNTNEYELAKVRNIGISPSIRNYQISFAGMKDQSLLNSLMIKVRICSERKYDIILGKGKNP